MTIEEAIGTMQLYVNDFLKFAPLAQKHKEEVEESINMGISALQTIQDGNYILNPSSIDLKTIYEYITAHSTSCKHSHNGLLSIETHRLDDTPICATIVQETNDKGYNAIIQILFEIKEK